MARKRRDLPPEQPEYYDPAFNQFSGELNRILNSPDPADKPRLSANRPHVPVINRLNHLVYLKQELNDESKRLLRVVQGDSLPPHEAPMCLPNGSVGWAQLRVLSEKVSPRTFKRLLRSSLGRQRARDVIDFELDRTRKNGILAAGLGLTGTVLANCVLPPVSGLAPVSFTHAGTFLDPVAALIRTAHAGPAVAEALASAAPLEAVAHAAGTVAVATIGIQAIAFGSIAITNAVSGFRNHAIGFGRRETLATREAIINADRAIEAEVAVVRNSIESLQEIDEHVIHAIGDQCVVEHMALVERRLSGPAAERAIARAEAIGPPPINPYARAQYDVLVTTAEVIRREHKAPDNVFPLDPDAPVQLKEYLQTFTPPPFVWTVSDHKEESGPEQQADVVDRRPTLYRPDLGFEP